MSVSLSELVDYWLGELPAEREAEVEELLFSDSDVARRLDAVRRLAAGVRRLVAAGTLQCGLTVEAVDELARAGFSIRTYEVGDGEVVPCTIALEDFVVIRLRGDFAGVDEVDVVMDGTFEGLAPASESYQGVPVDRSAGEIVLVYPGDRIRALPRSRFRYTVSGGQTRLGEFGLDHTPAA